MKFDLTEDGRATLVAYHGDEHFVRIPSQFEGRPVTGIGPGVFANHPLQILEVPASLRVIGDMAFQNCKNLLCIDYQLPQSLTLQWLVTDGFHASRFPPTLEVIGAHAFCRTSLEDIRFSSPELEIGAFAFQKSLLFTARFDSCKRLSLGDFAFAVCRNLESFFAPQAESRLGSFTFGGCRNLSHLVFCGEPEYWGDSFYGCGKLQTFQQFDDGRFTIDPRTLYQINGKENTYEMVSGREETPSGSAGFADIEPLQQIHLRPCRSQDSHPSVRRRESKQ